MWLDLSLNERAFGVTAVDEVIRESQKKTRYPMGGMNPPPDTNRVRVEGRKVHLPEKS